jgi:hypothetical protein
VQRDARQRVRRRCALRELTGVGNNGESSCSGVAFSRDELTGGPESSGDFLPAGSARAWSQASQPLDVSELRDGMTAVADQLTRWVP